MKGYWIARVNIKNQYAYKSYAQLAKPAIEKHSGKYLARGGKQKIYWRDASSASLYVEA